MPTRLLRSSRLEHSFVHVKSVEDHIPHVGVVRKFGEWGDKLDVVLVTLQCDSKLRDPHGEKIYTNKSFCVLRPLLCCGGVETIKSEPR
ncbi:hypothetical protein TNCV_1512551 [Trichonephila clavipes]|nr:hypothetical protein TNCV_1512551 [Trichonephila clavipes]